MKKRVMAGIGLIFLIWIMISASFASAQSATVCCEKTKPTESGVFYCQDVPADECAPDAKQVLTACRSTSYCKPGTCYDSNEGTCLDNTPQIVCNLPHGIWTETPGPECELGCCILGDQWSLVTLVRCKNLSASYGFETNYKKNIKDEASCSALVRNQDKGACVFEFEFQKTCRITTREDCSGGISGAQTKGTFFKGKLCSADELGTICGPSPRTTCVPGKEDVYFVDSCGNPANIYDASKYNDKNYWADMKDEKDSCKPTEANINSAGCGNCYYSLGSFCRKTSFGSAKATYGDHICADLNCHGTEAVLGKGKTIRLHGESWCIYNDKGSSASSNNAVGSGFYKYICEFGEIVLEACADFRNQVCIESAINYTGGTFSEALCRVNRWQDCTIQSSQSSCEDTNQRDCTWYNRCVPTVSPGLEFWDNSAQGICGQASTSCVATYTKRTGGSKKWSGDCVDSNGHINWDWVNTQVRFCEAMGDCGPKINWLGDSGTGGYTYSRA